MHASTIHPMYTASTFLQLVINQVDRALKRRGYTDRPEKTSIPLRATIATAITTRIDSILPEKNQEHPTQLIHEIIEHINKSLQWAGVQYRHPHLWLTKSAEEVAAHVNAMMYRNLRINAGISKEDFIDVYRDWGIELDDNESISSFKNKFSENYTETLSSTFEAIEFICDRYYLFFSDAEIAEINRKKSLDKIIEILDAKMKRRKKNDCLVQYGKMWSIPLINDTYAHFDRLGGIAGAATGVPLKHIGELEHGLTARIPEDELAGEFVKSNNPIRVYLRKPEVSQRPSPTFAAAFAQEREQYEKSEEAVYIDYLNLDDMIDDGWVLD